MLNKMQKLLKNYCGPNDCTLKHVKARLETIMKNKPQINDLYKKGGSNWRVVCTVADIFTLRNGKGIEVIYENLDLAGFRRVKKNHEY